MSASEVPMPAWAPPDGPWCLKRWLISGTAKFDLCLKALDHKGACRTIRHGQVDQRHSAFLGQETNR